MQTVTAYELLNCLNKMFAAVLFITGINTAVGFNIYTTPVHSYSNGDPLFGQNIIQSKDGVLVPSPSNGEVFRCAEKNCSKTVTELEKGPVASAASRLTDNKEQLLVCNQVRTKKSSTEYLNGKCTHYYDNKEKSEIYPDKLVLQMQLLEGNTNIINNNNTHQDHGRKRRALQSSADEEDDAGTEIAFVLDGSGSIDKEDFIKAKDFIINIMKNVWKTCFSCDFAIVQFGKDIRTELSLTENNDTQTALDKVKNIKQVNAITMTASALYHVLTEIFVPQSGSKENATKMIILLSDGKMAGDNRTLEEVLNMPQMQGIVRYAIGVGPEVVNKRDAVKEMIEISGSEDRYFNVSNYGALEKILSSLEKSIIGIEGIQKGAGFQFELAEAGFSSHFTRDGSILFGAVGAYDWSGGIILKKRSEEHVTFFNASKEEHRFSYLGYSVASVSSNKKTLYISGAPRHSLTGAVFIFDGTEQDLLQGDQVGSYFGSVLCASDINNDGETDYLLVGAPHFHVKGEEGKVLLYRMKTGKFEKEAELRGLEKHVFARFGSAIADIGDIDGNNFRDIAVGAPLEEDHAGSVYIYNSFNTGLDRRFSQRITPSDFESKLVHFGQAVSAMSENREPLLISVGSKGAITVFKKIPVIVIRPKINVTTDLIAIDKQTSDESSKFDINLKICFNTPKGDIKTGELLVEYDIDLDWGKEQKRLVFVNPNEGRMHFTLTDSKTCPEIIYVKYMGCSDCFSPIKIRVNFTLTPTIGLPLRVLDAYSPKEAFGEINFKKECQGAHCKAHISLADSKLSNDNVIIGSTRTLDIKFDFKNSGDNSYLTNLTVMYPELLSFKKSEGGTCENNNDNNQLVCKLLYPVFKRNAETSVTITWQPINSNTHNTESIAARLTGGNDGSEVLDSNTYNFTVKKALPVILSASATPNRLNITEGEKSKKQMLQFDFKLEGKNEYKAKINVTITIVKQTYKTDLVIMSIKPQNCTLPSDKNIKSKAQITCTLTELQEIKIMAETQIHDIKDITEMITAVGEITFDRILYDGVNNIEKVQVQVSLVKLSVVTSVALIAGSSIGGFILLIFIIVILFKCGFFRRRHKMDRKMSTN